MKTTTTMRLPVMLLCATMLMGLFSSTDALAATKRQAALKHFQAGQAALDGRQYDAAIGEFTRALELVPSPRLLYGIALANDRKGDATAAVTWYRRAGRDAKAGARLKALSAAAVKRLTAQSTVILRGLPEDASVFVDGKLGTVDDDRAVTVSPGEHWIRVSAKGRTPFRKVVTIARGERHTIQVELPEAPGQLIVRVNRPNARLAVDGVDVGKLDGRPIPVPAGKHRLHISAPGADAATFSVALAPGQTRELKALLNETPEPGPSRKTFHTWGAISASVGAAALITGITLSITAADKQGKLSEARRLGDITPESKTAVAGYITRLERASYGMYALAGTGAIAATTLFLLAPDRDPSVSPAFAATPGGGLFGVQGTF